MLATELERWETRRTNIDDDGDGDDVRQPQSIQYTWLHVCPAEPRVRRRRNEVERSMKLSTYRNTVRVLLANALGLGLALLKGVLVLELAAHLDCWEG